MQGRQENFRVRCRYVNAAKAMMMIEINDPDLTALYAYWTAKRGIRAMPQRADINPTEIKPLLPHLFMVEIHEPLRFRFRLVGTAICNRWHRDNTGKWLDELSGLGEGVVEQYTAVARAGEPRWHTAEFLRDGYLYVNYRRLLLPLSEDGVSPNMLLGIQKAIGLDGYEIKEPVPNWI